MNAEVKLLKAKVQLILEQPFFAALALNLQYHPDATVNTLVTNGKRIRYNPSIVDQLSIDELKTALAEEVMHTALLHHTRRSGRNLRKWNLAADYSINPLLIAAGFILPKDVAVNTLYEGKSAEQIYDMIPDSPDGNSPNDDDANEPSKPSSGIGDVEDAPAEDNTQEIEAQVKEMLSQAYMIAKRQGKLPTGLDRTITEILQPRLDWREVLSRFVCEITKNDYTWSKPSMRFLHSGIYLPCLESTETGTIVLIADTSISIDHNLLNCFATEVQDIATTFNTVLQVIYVDERVQAVQTIDPDQPIKLEPRGGGGTDFRPGFTYIEENCLQPKAVVYLTDGECESFPEDPDYPVLWAQFGDYDFSPPFGEVVQVA